MRRPRPAVTDVADTPATPAEEGRQTVGYSRQYARGVMHALLRREYDAYEPEDLLRVLPHIAESVNDDVIHTALARSCESSGQPSKTLKLLLAQREHIAAILDPDSLSALITTLVRKLVRDKRQESARRLALHFPEIDSLIGDGQEALIEDVCLAIRRQRAYLPLFSFLAENQMPEALLEDRAYYTGDAIPLDGVQAARNVTAKSPCCPKAEELHMNALQRTLDEGIGPCTLIYMNDRLIGSLKRPEAGAQSLLALTTVEVDTMEGPVMPLVRGGLYGVDSELHQQALQSPERSLELTSLRVQPLRFLGTMMSDPERGPAYYRASLKKLTANLEKRLRKTRRTVDRNDGPQKKS